ncbi:inovirus-type Gp2 protein [Halorhodospira halochloris]|uniref:YagK/YfjJ domain-containing protein n=1 Tax=Halorhodospira halochloris TaxID=1052 RepID=UPI001EE931B7|nr:inovirus-type Gp2 protein [Halorhodospira halochloris]MCG5531663.1 inovirus-type Gp2 protein [Halorhodospira halochloris]
MTLERQQAPLVPRQLRSLQQLLTRAREANGQTLAICFNLHCPTNITVQAMLAQGNGLISLFWKHLYSQFLHSTISVYPDLRFAWCREDDPETGQVTYRVLALLHARAFREAIPVAAEHQDLPQTQSLAGCIVRAWGEALQLPHPPPPQIVSFPIDPSTGQAFEMHLDARDATAWDHLYTFTSALCRNDAKAGHGLRVFQTSMR